MPFCSNCGTEYVELPVRCGCGYLTATAPASPAATADQPGCFAFGGNGAELLLLYLKTFFLSLLTLGVYSFWGRTEIRKFYWRNTSFAGQRFDYHGTGKELFLGALKFFALLAAWFTLALILASTSGERNAPWILAVLYLPMFLLAPVALHGAFRYRASRTSWQGRRFAYRGDLWRFVGAFCWGALLTVLTLSLYLPFFFIRLRGEFFDNLYYGGQRFHFQGEGRDLLQPYLKFLLLFLPTLSLYRFWFLAEQDNYGWEKTSFAGATFRSTIRGGEMLVFSTLQVLAGVFTFGIALPWVRCARTRYVMENLVLTKLPNVQLLVQSPDDADGFGEAAGNLLGADTGIGEGFGL